MPERRIVDDEQYRYAYQGQEKDPETGKEAFELRLWDGRIGRWLSIDPYGEFHSPYLGMGNNPVSIIDPNGGCTICPKNANVNDTFEHPEYGKLFFDGTDWGNERFGVIMDDVIVTGKGVEGLSPIARADWERFHMDLLPKIQHDTWEMEKNILIPIAAVTAAPIVAGELLGFAGTSSLFETSSIPEYQFSSVETIMINNTERQVLRNSLGQFAKGTHQLVKIEEIFQSGYSSAYGLNSLGQATSFTPVLAETITIAPVYKYVLSATSAGLIVYLYSRKELDKNKPINP